MSQQIVIAEQARIAALLKDDRVDELIVAQGQYQIGDIFLGTVENVLPGIDAAFIDIGGSEKNGFIHVSDLGPLKLKKSSVAITELLEPKQKVVVQVMKEPTSSKGPRLTGNISLPGKFLILQPFGQGVNISRRINAGNERSRLKALGVLIKPPGTGLLFRTESENINEELLIEDLENLIQKWESILQISDSSNPPLLINRDEDFSLKILRDYINASIKTVTIDNKSATERAIAFLSDNDKKVNVEFYNDSKNEHILEKYKIDLAIKKALQPRVDLPSGGYIIIEPTEALTVINVNSGSFTRSANSRQTVLWTNCEAAIEIARQMKLRNIGGILVIDFIDMDSRRDQFQLLEHFTSAIKEDSARPQIAQLTELGLVELTRKRQGQNIYELFGTKSNQCDSLGQLINLQDFEKENLEYQKGSKKTKKTSNIEEITLETEDNLKTYSKPEEKDINWLTNHNEEYISTKKKEMNDENKGTVSSNEKEIISVDLNEDEKIVFSQLGINPLIKLGKEYINSNNVAKLEVNSPNKKINSSKKTKKIKNKVKDTTDLKDNEFLKESTIDDNNQTVILETQIKDNNHIKEYSEIDSDNDIDISRRKRRRSSATSE
ncbi:MAG: ribonuclease E/G [Prochlorococcus sp. SP3034]|nr:ribonuclease E/G [Prochlorococcus sp. SP3034]